jgi:hypothetical protein
MLAIHIMSGHETYTVVSTLIPPVRFSRCAQTIGVVVSCATSIWARSEVLVEQQLFIARNNYISS